MAVNDTVLFAVREDSDDFRLSGLRQRVEECGAEHFDPRGTLPFSYIQNLLIVGAWEESVQYLLRQNDLIPAVNLGCILYYYGLLQGADNVFVSCLTRLLPQIWARVELCLAYVSVLREEGVKTDLCVVGLRRRRHVGDRAGQPRDREAGGEEGGGWAAQQGAARPDARHSRRGGREECCCRAECRGSGDCVLIVF